MTFTKNPALEFVVNTHKETEGKTVLEVIAFDDRKEKQEMRQTFFDLSHTPLEKIQEEIEIFNVGYYGVYINVNPLMSEPRRNVNIKKYVFCFIDLDDATSDHKELIKTFLNKNNIKYSYLGKSGSGYHFLIRINLETSEQDKVKGFLNYLKNNVCDKVDITTNDPARIFRAPLSIHNKHKEPFELITEELNYITNEQVNNNTELILQFQEENRKAVLDIKYLSSIERTDIFFSEILNQQDNWEKIFKILNKHDKDNKGEGNNKIFNKNFAIFVSKNPSFKDKATLFFKSWNNRYVTLERFEYYLNKVSKGTLFKDGSSERENSVNYFELMKWSKTYNFKLFINLLMKQLKNSFLDEIEFYYLEDEKPEYQYLIYYCEKDYFIQKNIVGLIDVIYYEAREKGIDLIKEWNISTTDENGKPLNHSTIIKSIRSNIYTKLDKQNRIKKIFNINYAPCNEKFLYYDNKKFFNIYSKTNYWEYYKHKEKYSFPHIKELLMNLCGHEEESYNWFNHWLGWQIQHNSKKLPTAVIFQGQQGTGKGVLKTHILDNIFGVNVQEINQTHLESSFNEYLLGKQIIVANEVIHNENKALLPNVLKNLVTDPEITISRKFRKEIIGKNYTHWIFCTNNENPLRIDIDDRRYSVFYSKKLKGGEKEAVKFVHELQKNLDYELKEYISYLKDLDIKEYYVRFPLMTAAKKEIIDLNRDTVSKFVEYIQKHNEYISLHLDLFDNDEKYDFIDVGDGIKYPTTDDLYLLYLEWAKKYKERGTFNKQNFGRKLASYGVNTLIKKKKGKSLRVYNPTELEILMEANKE